ncbi:DNA alkylation repair protein [Empedobacter sedimenti]|uniref:DNA alkylation repair protein n=1 Tax=Empedobacter sedimenti TaxID=3042610 RepID=UPI0024A79AD9|nr:DNA alkylation repair protein [Empedobacter sedimenti]
MVVNQVRNSLQDLVEEGKAEIMKRFFKTGKGEYGEGDQFLGITVPNQRLVAKEFYLAISLDELKELLQSTIHEYRLTALLMLVSKYQKSKDIDEQKRIVDFYLSNTTYINNWDLVDTSCYNILGHYCFHHNQENLLFDLAQSDDMWEKRIAIVSTNYYIRKKVLDVVPEIVVINLNHPHDLMHKANGWMLREMGKKDDEKLIHFLDEYTLKLPRTTLRYAVEKMDPTLKDYYMKLK